MSQAAEALAQANTIRYGMADKRRQLQALPRDEALELAAEWISEPDEFVGRMKVGYLLESIPRVGRSKAVRYLGRVGCSAAHLERRVKLVHNKRRNSSDYTYAPISLRARAALVDLLRTEAERARSSR